MGGFVSCQDLRGEFVPIVIHDTIKITAQEPQVSTKLVKLLDCLEYETGTVGVWGVYISDSEMHSKNVAWD